jgi:hypothetical protein
MVGDAVTAQTPTYGLTYTTGTDLLCDGADILAQLEDDFAAALLTIEADVDRLTVIPYALVSAYNIIYDAVEADTANMVDLGTAADAIFWNPTTNQTGVWMNGFTTAYASGHITYTITRNIDENNSVTQTTARIDGSFMALGTPQQNTVGVNGLYAITSTATPASMVAQMNPTYDGTAGGHLQAQQPHMWMFWMRDPA